MAARGPINSRILIFLVQLSFIFLFISCGNESDPVKETTTTTGIQEVKKTRVVPPDFSADSAFAFVKYQADLGPRNPGSKAHANCAKWFETKLKGYGAQTYINGGIGTTFDQKKWQIKNVIACFNLKSKTRILLCAHWDSRPFCDRDTLPANKTKACPGVNDGASGAGVLVELARCLKQKAPSIGVDIVLFDLEDYGQPENSSFPPMEDSWCLGSQFWAQNPHVPGYYAKYGILLDMVGAKGATFAKEGHSMIVGPEVITKIWNTAYTLGYGKYYIHDQFQEITDDHQYISRLANIPCVEIIHYNPTEHDFFPHHHRLSDDISNIDKETLKAVGQPLLEIIYNE